ncbi:potassium-transporting ATPase KdpC subunit [Ktedonobacter robiniae]|uniref:Potassium-transporting ATPase KdpC subunit n=2 Tax=Ktedonobacter robiniae TaxID=2778365 RepID=A0ABQ3V719_9CHLR|nr:potassium-transporting ATPase subunit KdpC [Ktedonobacter robiniae]GHO60205.1 potassium-transporting ATPase KdpC subunit [Ktedonobacter robiniae]
MALEMKKQIRPAIVLTLLLTVVTGLLYPGIVTGLAQLLFPSQANGSLHTVNGQVIGSDLIGQYWTAPKYFHGRPSATVSVTDSSKSEPYNAQNSAASNLGPTNKNLQDAVQERVKELQKENPGVPVPVDLVTTSGSGLDPDISVAGALFQVPRIAKERGMSEDQVRALVMKHVQGRFLGILGEEHVNVLELNLALDGK